MPCNGLYSRPGIRTMDGSAASFAARTLRLMIARPRPDLSTLRFCAPFLRSGRPLGCVGSLLSQPKHCESERTGETDHVGGCGCAAAGKRRLYVGRTLQGRSRLFPGQLKKHKAGLVRVLWELQRRMGGAAAQAHSAGAADSAQDEKILSPPASGMRHKLRFA